MAETAPLTQALQWIGFEDEHELELLEAELGDLEALQDVTKKDITTLAKVYGSMHEEDDQIMFGLVRTKRLQALVQWVQDFQKTGTEPNLAGLTEATFLEEIKESARREEIRLVESETMDTRSKNAEPGKLKGEKGYLEWEAKFENQLSVLQGVNGIPLVYVIREKAVPDDEEEFENFQAECIARAPLDGPAFEADSRQVRNHSP